MLIGAGSRRRRPHHRVGHYLHEKLQLVYPLNRPVPKDRDQESSRGEHFLGGLDAAGRGCLAMHDFGRGRERWGESRP
jgi:hypothetical protein